MDFELPPDDDPRRLAVRSWLAAHPTPTGRELAEAGYVAPHWPRPWGLDADPVHQIVIDEELAAADVRRPTNPIGIGWAGPTLVHGGTEQQKERYLFPMLAGEEMWCQLFSEPGSGSDLASLGTRAVRDGDEWVVNGQKIWTSLAQFSKFGILIARTEPDAPKHEGISYFVCPMDAPGVEIRPIIEMTGAHSFNEVFFDDVRLPAENLVGDVNRGWGLAKVTLGNERVSLSAGGALWGRGPTAEDLLDLVRAAGGTQDAVLRQRLAAPPHRARAAAADPTAHGHRPHQGRAAGSGGVGAEDPRRRARPGDHGPGQGPRRPRRDARRPRAPRRSGRPVELRLPVLARAHGRRGDGEVQRNIVAERVLGLPHDTDVEQGQTWSESRR